MTPTRPLSETERTQVAYVAVGIAAVKGLLGLFLTFYPGAEAGWFGVAAAVSLIGLLAPSRRLRFVAVVLAILLAACACGGYVRGWQYREWLSQHPELRGSPAQRAK
jgi:hypothetical protein